MIDPAAIKGKTELFIDFEDRLTLFDSLILCRFFRDFYPLELLEEIIHAVTELPPERETLHKIASTIADEVRCFNIREGLSRADDSLPPRFHKETLKTGHVITEEELSFMLDDYYRLRGFSPMLEKIILDILVHLERLRRETENTFPATRGFLRTGFDRVELKG